MLKNDSLCTIRGETLRKRLEESPIVITPGAYDSWSARLIEQAGFPAIYLTGYGVTAASLGMPDLGLITGSELADQVRRISDVTRVPLIADADTGFGGVLNVRRTVHDYIRAGAAAIQLEDQVSPKRCGHMDDKQVTDVTEMVEKIHMAVDARGDVPLQIIARTDARATHDLDEALRRGERYLRAGADILFVEAPRTEEEMARICGTFRGEKLLANMVEGGKTPYLSPATLQQIGYAIAIYPATLLFSATYAIGRTLSQLCDGRIDTAALASFSQFNERMGLQDYFAATDRIQSNAREHAL
ncbi:isocitrate lyase/PEP mutase family protein (plasmid) [Cupriavidus sp. P-10]|uniref:isocitrate lyase/PEP mutase family protein n=1 Tax=unclassified Cupriavidus TaxID=2640874 RepID=UPI000E2FE54C|nr:MULTISPECIES: isocitrate lyase/PEP mutase family protein [unclassified Cupriavidus]BDB29751.1 isocitrate lyase/PEP mutase family protein [Cupriavidus sp. P-10]